MQVKHRVILEYRNVHL